MIEDILDEAEAYLASNQTTEALRLYSQLLEDSKDASPSALFEANNNMGVCFTELNRYIEALDCYNTAILIRIKVGKRNLTTKHETFLINLFLKLPLAFICLQSNKLDYLFVCSL